MQALLRILTGRRSAWAVLVLAVLAVGAAFALLPKDSSSGYPDAGLPDSAQSAQVAELLKSFPSADATAAVVVYTATDGAQLSDAERQAVQASAGRLAGASIAPPAVRPEFSDDGRAALVTVPLSAQKVSADVGAAADTLRTTARADLPDGLDAQVTGPVGFQADTAGAFAGADLRLLGLTVLVVAVLLVVTYRSPVLWIVPLAVIGTADGLSRLAVGALADAVGFTMDPSVSGIMSVLVFGAGTNYALLLVARYREALTRVEDTRAAMREALASAGPAILASGGTVTLGLMTMLSASLTSNRLLGFACGAGVTIAITFALLVLPSAVVVCGRRLFWPFVPALATGDGGARPGMWKRVGLWVSGRPGRVALGAGLGLGVLALGLGSYGVGLPLTDQLLGNPESVQAQQTLDAHFPAADTATAVVLTPTGAQEQATALAQAVPGVHAARPTEAAGGLERLDLTLSGDPQSQENFTAVQELRRVYAEAAGPVSQSLVGGQEATTLDERTAAAADQRLIMPLILAVVALVLLVLLRSLVAPVLLIASVLATFAAALGAGSWLFVHVLGYKGLDTSVTLYSFLFLVALGVDYNIFLTTRAREERAHLGTRRGMVEALGSTGGVITSAGVLLAAVFAVLGVLPVLALAQIGVIVCLGVLLDTLVVRTALVPALVFLLGDRFWWPSRVPSAPRKAEGADVAPLVGQRQE